MEKRFTAIMGVFVFASLVGIVLVNYVKSKDLRNANGRIESVLFQVAELQSQNERLSNQLQAATSVERLSARDRNELMQLRAELPALRSQSNELARALEKMHRDLRVAIGQSPAAKRLPADLSLQEENAPIPSATLPPREPDPAMLTAAYDHARLNQLPAMIATLDEHPDYLNQPVGVRGSTLLHTAAYNGHADVLKELLRRGSTVNQRNFTGETPLYSAILRGTPEVVRLLLDAGADPSIPDNNGLTPLRLAHARNRLEMAELLQAKGVRE